MRFHYLHTSVWPVLLMVNPMLWFAVSVSICVGTDPDLPIHNSIALSMVAPMLTSGGKKESTMLYSNKSAGTESHSTSTKGGSGVFDSRTPDFVLMKSMCLWFWTVGSLVDVSARSVLAATACSIVATLSAALRVPAMPLAAIVGFVFGSALYGRCPLPTSFQSYALLDSHWGMLDDNVLCAGSETEPLLVDCDKICSAGLFPSVSSWGLMAYNAMAGCCRGEILGLKAEKNGCCCSDVASGFMSSWGLMAYNLMEVCCRGEILGSMAEENGCCSLAAAVCRLVGALVVADLVVLVLKNNGFHTFQEASAAALECIYCKFGCFGAAAAAAALVSALAHASQAESAACAWKKPAVKKAQQAAAAAAAALLGVCSEIVAFCYEFEFSGHRWKWYLESGLLDLGFY